MKVIERHKISPQKCRTCGSVFQLEYKDLKWEDTVFKSRKNRWKCPFCKEDRNFIYNFDKGE